MKTEPTPTASAIFQNINRKNPTAIFLAVKEDGLQLSFGSNRTRVARFSIHLYTPGQEIELHSGSATPTPFILILDQNATTGALRMALYMEPGPTPVYECDGTDEGNYGLFGQILILAHEEHGDGQAVLHAVACENGQSSLLVDASPKLLRHLELSANLTKEGHGHGLPDELDGDTPLVFSL